MTERVAGLDARLSREVAAAVQEARGVAEQQRRLADDIRQAGQASTVLTSTVQLEQSPRQMVDD